MERFCRKIIEWGGKDYHHYDKNGEPVSAEDESLVAEEDEEKTVEDTAGSSEEETSADVDKASCDFVKEEVVSFTCASSLASTGVISDKDVMAIEREVADVLVDWPVGEFV